MKAGVALLALIVFLPASLAAEQDTVGGGKLVARSVVAEDVAREFETNDLDHDGTISLDEWRADAPDKGFDASEAQSVFAKIDTNGDARATPQELTDWQYALFDCLDTNRDGALTRADKRANAPQCMIDRGFSPQRFEES
jgi:hypothetical protein